MPAITAAIQFMHETDYDRSGARHDMQMTLRGLTDRTMI